MILSWTGARLEGGQYEKANVNATDNHNSTCMHYSAAAGMKICVEVRERVWRSILSRFWRLYQLDQPTGFLPVKPGWLYQTSSCIKSVCFVFDYCQIQAEHLPLLVGPWLHLEMYVLNYREVKRIWTPLFFVFFLWHILTWSFHLVFSSHLSGVSLFPALSPSLAADSERSRPFCWGRGEVNAVWSCWAAQPHWAGPEPGVADGFFLLITSALKCRHTEWKHPAAVQGRKTTVARSGVSCWPISAELFGCCCCFLRELVLIVGKCQHSRHIGPMVWLLIFDFWQLVMTGGTDMSNSSSSS